MKKIMKYMLSFFMILSLTGCMKMTMTIDVDNDGEVTTSTKVVASESFLESMGKENFIKQLKDDYEADNVTVKEVTETHNKEKYYGVTATSDKGKSSIKATIKNNTVTIKIPLSELQSDSLSKESLDKYGYTVNQLKNYGVEAKVIINMPQEATSNVGTVEDNKVTIDLLDLMDSNKKYITVSSKLHDYTPYYIGGGIAAVVIIVGGIIIIRRRKKNKKKEEA